MFEMLPTRPRHGTAWTDGSSRADVSPAIDSRPAIQQALDMQAMLWDMPIEEGELGMPDRLSSVSSDEVPDLRETIPQSTTPGFRPLRTPVDQMETPRPLSTPLRFSRNARPVKGLTPGAKRKKQETDGPPRAAQLGRRGPPHRRHAGALHSAHFAPLLGDTDRTWGLPSIGNATGELGRPGHVDSEALEAWNSLAGTAKMVHSERDARSAQAKSRPRATGPSIQLFGVGEAVSRSGASRGAVAGSNPSQASLQSGDKEEGGKWRADSELSRGADRSVDGQSAAGSVAGGGSVQGGGSAGVGGSLAGGSLGEGGSVAGGGSLAAGGSLTGGGSLAAGNSFNEGNSVGAGRSLGDSSLPGAGSLARVDTDVLNTEPSLGSPRVRSPPRSPRRGENGNGGGHSGVLAGVGWLDPAWKASDHAELALDFRALAPARPTNLRPRAPTADGPMEVLRETVAASRKWGATEFAGAVDEMFGVHSRKGSSPLQARPSMGSPGSPRTPKRVVKQRENVSPVRPPTPAASATALIWAGAAAGTAPRRTKAPVVTKTVKGSKAPPVSMGGLVTTNHPQGCKCQLCRFGNAHQSRRDRSGNARKPKR